MRFGISATSLMCPKNLRTRLRPVNVCCAIVASHFVAPRGRTFRGAIGIAPGLNFDSFLAPKSTCQDLNPESGHRTFRTQNDARGAKPHPPVTTIDSRTEKARNCLSPNGLRRNAAVPAASPCFRAAAPIWGDHRGESWG